MYFIGYRSRVYISALGLVQLIHSGINGRVISPVLLIDGGMDRWEIIESIQLLQLGFLGHRVPCACVDIDCTKPTKKITLCLRSKITPSHYPHDSVENTPRCTRSDIIQLAGKRPRAKKVIFSHIRRKWSNAPVCVSQVFASYFHGLDSKVAIISECHCGVGLVTKQPN